MQLGHAARRAARCLIPPSGCWFTSSAALLQCAVASLRWPLQPPAASGASGQPGSEPPGEPGPRGRRDRGHGQASHRRGGGISPPPQGCPGLAAGVQLPPGESGAAGQERAGGSGGGCGGPGRSRGAGRGRGRPDRASARLPGAFFAGWRRLCRRVIRRAATLAFPPNLEVVLVK